MAAYVKGMPRASLLEDGTMVELAFDTDGEPVTLSFDPDQLEYFASRAVALIRDAQNRRRATSGHAEVHASAVAEIDAAAPVGGGRVILLIRGENGIVQSFAISLEQSAGPRPALRKAEESARAQAGQSRQ